MWIKSTRAVFLPMFLPVFLPVFLYDITLTISIYLIVFNVYLLCVYEFVFVVKRVGEEKMRKHDLFPHRGPHNEPRLHTDT